MNASIPSRLRRLFTVSMLAALVASTPPAARAADLFVLTANGAFPTVTVGASSVVDLIEQAVNRSGAFTGLGAITSGALNYAGVANAITYSSPANGMSSITIPSTGFSQNFNSTAALTDFLKSNGSAELAKFFKAMAAQSLVTITDGNPNATTTRAASGDYQSYSMTLAETNEEKTSGKPEGGRLGVGIVADVGSFNANGIKGTVYSLPMFARFKLTDRVGLNFDLPLSFTEIEKAKAYGVGVGLGIPVKVIPRTKGNPWTWQLTPSGAANGTGSKDLAAGGLVANGALNSLAAREFGKFTVSMGNHFSLHQGVPLSVSGYTFDTGVSQQILKNGLKLDVPFGRRWIFDAYAVHTKLLAPAAVDQYFTIGGELGYRLLGKADGPKKGGYLKLGMYADVGNNYTSAHIRFGSGWKF